MYVNIPLEKRLYIAATFGRMINMYIGRRIPDVRLDGRAIYARIKMNNFFYITYELLKFELPS